MSVHSSDNTHKQKLCENVDIAAVLNIHILLECDGHLHVCWVISMNTVDVWKLHASIFPREVLF